MNPLPPGTRLPWQTALFIVAEDCLQRTHVVAPGKPLKVFSLGAVP